MQTENKKKITFIVNPISGTSSKKGFDAIVDKVMDSNLYSWRIVRTGYAGHAAEIAAASAEAGHDICVAVGGDGTVNEVARALVGTQTALGIVPCGSGNGLARHLCLPMSMKGALGIINKGQTDTFDYGIINGKPFFCTCGMGFDAHVSLLFSQKGKRGLATYAQTVLQEGLKYSGDTYDVELEEPDGKTLHQKAFLIACANAAQYGNNTYIAPGASMQDGMLEVVIVEDIKSTARTKLLMDLFTRTIRSNRHVKIYQARRLHVHREQEGAVHFDGDPTVMGTDIEIELVARGLKAIVNPAKTEDHAGPNRMMQALNKMTAGKQ
ncbi:MAG: YegS/Rv2252/BmrU family lipid kinase [Prevotella sp.]|nr:YegS/Rv2252/BmrU family lipid kinase [Prevotella sp.]